MNRGRTATVGGTGGGSSVISAAALISGFQALDTWDLLDSMDLGVNQATTAGRMSSKSTSGTSGTNWTTAAAANEPVYVTIPELGSLAAITGDGAASMNTITTI